jgi:hypothetical protein
MEGFDFNSDIDNMETSDIFPAHFVSHKGTGRMTSAIYFFRFTA